MESNALTPEDAAKLWKETVGELGIAIVRTIRKMGLPASQGGPLEQRLKKQLSTLGRGEVLAVLVRDTQLHDDIVQEVGEQFWSAVRRGKLPATTTRGLLFHIAKCTTWRVSTRRARDLAARVQPTGNGDPLDSIDDRTNSNERVIDHVLITQLRHLWDGLNDMDRRVLTAKLEDAYEQAAVELGIAAGTLRVRAHRLCQRLQAQLSDRSHAERLRGRRASKRVRQSEKSKP